MFENLEKLKLELSAELETIMSSIEQLNSLVQELNDKIASLESSVYKTDFHY